MKKFCEKLNSFVSSWHHKTSDILVNIGSGNGLSPGPVFCLLLGVSSDYAQPITGQVTEVTCPVIGQAQPELTPSKRQKTGSAPYQAVMLTAPPSTHLLSSSTVVSEGGCNRDLSLLASSSSSYLRKARTNFLNVSMFSFSFRKDIIQTWVLMVFQKKKKEKISSTM